LPQRVKRLGCVDIDEAGVVVHLDPGDEFGIRFLSKGADRCEFIDVARLEPRLRDIAMATRFSRRPCRQPFMPAGVITGTGLASSRPLSVREFRRTEDDAIRDAARMPYLARLLPLHQDKPRDTPEALGFLRIAAAGCGFVEMPQPQSRVQQ
jgi:hypothetical protein